MDKVLGFRKCNFCKKKLDKLLDGKQYCSELCVERCRLKTALYRARNPKVVEANRLLQEARRKLPENLKRASVWQKGYHLRNRLKRIKMQKARYETNKKIVKDVCRLCGSKENLQVHHNTYVNFDDFAVVCESCHRTIHRKYKDIRGVLIALSKVQRKA